MRKIMVCAVCAFALAAAMACFGCSSGTTSSASASSASASAASSVAVSASASVASTTASASSSAAQGAASLTEGVYTVDVDTDSSMFHINESKNGKGELTVSPDGMSVHMTLASTRITNLYVGTADQAKTDPDGVIQPTTDKVTYSDGVEEEVFGFDVPVPALNEEFAVAILGEKGNWYDHKVTVSNPVKN